MRGCCPWGPAWCLQCRLRAGGELGLVGPGEAWSCRGRRQLPTHTAPALVGSKDSICFWAKGITSSHLSWLFCEVFFVSFSSLCSHLQGSNRGLSHRAAPFERAVTLCHTSFLKWHTEFFQSACHKHKSTSHRCCFLLVTWPGRIRWFCVHDQFGTLTLAVLSCLKTKWWRWWVGCCVPGRCWCCLWQAAV